MDELRTIEKASEPPRIFASFQRQEWTGRRDDCAMPVGKPELIDVTTRVLRMSAADITSLSDDSIEGDALVEGRHDHGGPFAVYIRQEVEDFLEEHGIYDPRALTDIQLAKLRKTYKVDPSVPEPKDLLWYFYLGPIGSELSVPSIADGIKGMMERLHQPSVFTTTVTSQLYNETGIVMSRDILTNDEATELYEAARSEELGESAKENLAA